MRFRGKGPQGKGHGDAALQAVAPVRVAVLSLRPNVFSRGSGGRAPQARGVGSRRSRSGAAASLGRWPPPSVSKASVFPRPASAPARTPSSPGGQVSSAPSPVGPGDAFEVHLPCRVIALSGPSLNPPARTLSPQEAPGPGDGTRLRSPRHLSPGSAWLRHGPHSCAPAAAFGLSSSSAEGGRGMCLPFGVSQSLGIAPPPTSPHPQEDALVMGRLHLGSCPGPEGKGALCHPAENRAGAAGRGDTPLTWPWRAGSEH